MDDIGVMETNVVQVWFLKVDTNDELTIQINKALEKLDDDSGLTHTLFRPCKNLLFDVTINENTLTYLPDYDMDKVQKLANYVVEIKPLHPTTNYVKVMERINQLQELGIKLKIKDIQHWFRHRGNKDNVLLCTDIVVDILAMTGTIPDNLLPSQLLAWFDEYKDDQAILDELKAEYIKIIDLTDG